MTTWLSVLAQFLAVAATALGAVAAFWNPSAGQASPSVRPLATVTDLTGEVGADADPPSDAGARGTRPDPAEDGRRGPGGHTGGGSVPAESGMLVDLPFGRLELSPAALEGRELDLAVLAHGEDGGHPLVQELRLTLRAASSDPTPEHLREVEEAADRARARGEELTPEEVRLVDETYLVLGIDRRVEPTPPPSTEQQGQDQDQRPTPPARVGRSWHDGPASIAVLVGDFADSSLDDVCDAIQRVVPPAASGR